MGEVFDVRVLAFAAGSEQTLHALQELFGLDEEAAQRMIDNVPMVVRRAAPANEAHDYVEALRNIGAEVALERPEQPQVGDRPTAAKAPPAPPVPKPPAAPAGRPAAAKPPVPKPPAAKPLAPKPPMPKPPAAASKAQLPKPKAPPPPPRDSDPPLPKPVVRALTADLEFDLAASRGGEPAAMRGDPAPASAAATPARRTGKRERSEFEWSTAGAGSLELDVEAARPPVAERTSDKAASGGERGALELARPAAAASGDPPPGRVAGAEAVRAAGPISRAAVVHKPGPVSLTPARQRRQLGLLRVLGAVLIAAAGIWLDSSVVYGNANVFSVLAHAVAIYQCGIGLRRMVS